MRVYLFSSILLFCSCQSNSQKEHLFSLPGEWAVTDSVATKIKLGIEKGDVEYFSINGNQFRFQKSAQKNNLYDIQLKTDNGWITKLSLPMPKETFFLTHDFDLDNNFDLSYLEYGNINIHFFDKTSQRFILKPMQFSYDCALLDSSKLIYGVNNHGSAEWNIDIFSIKDRTKIFLFKAKLFLRENPNNADFRITSALLYKCRNGVEGDTVLISKMDINKQFSRFSLLRFMKEIAHNKAYR